MTHFPTEAWIDFVRSLVPAAEARIMQAHLDSGCRPCSSLEATLQQVADAAESERRWRVPAAPLRLTRLCFHLDDARARATTSPLQQLLDSAQQAVSAGGRGSTLASERRLVYRSDDYVLELVVREAALQGQIVTLRRKRLQQVPVFVVAQGDNVASTLTRRGLFEIEGEFEPPCEVLLFPDEERCLTASWGPPVSPEVLRRRPGHPPRLRQ